MRVKYFVETNLTLPLGEGRVRVVCAVQVFPAREDELANPEVEVRRGRY